MIRREYSRSARVEGSLARRRTSGKIAGMVRTLDHLPAGKRAELAFVVDVLRTSFDQERSTRYVYSGDELVAEYNAAGDRLRAKPRRVSPRARSRGW